MSDRHDDHLTDDAWERLAMDELPPGERAAALRHVTSCPACTAIYKGVLALEAGARAAGLDGPPAREASVDEEAPIEQHPVAARGADPARRPRARPRWRWAAAGAAVAAAAALLLWWQTRPVAVRDEPGGVRGPGAAVVRVRPPRGTPPTLDWAPVAGASGYRVSVFTDDGQPVWTRAVAAPPVAWPADVAAAPGAYRWKVEALGPAGVLATSPLVGVRIAP